MLLLAREGEWGSGTQWGLGLVAHSPKLSAYLGGARLLQLPLQFLAAHAASRWIEFWRSLKPAHDHFAQSGLPAPIEPGVAGYRLPGHESLVEPGSIRVTAP